MLWLQLKLMEGDLVWLIVEPGDTFIDKVDEDMVLDHLRFFYLKLVASDCISIVGFRDYSCIYVHIYVRILARRILITCSRCC